MQQPCAECRLCKDTGRLKSGDRSQTCWCAAGAAARQEDRERGAPIREVTTTATQGAFAGIVGTRPSWVKAGDEWLSWEKTLALGRDYMVGSEVTMSEFLRSHRSRLNAW
jgi:hypothetical protein